MSELTNKAIARITAECEGKDYLIPFEEHLTEICTNDAVAVRILDDKKTLEGCFDVMKAKAKNRAVNGCAFIPPEEGYQIIEDYYEITEPKTKPAAHNMIDITDLL